MTLVKLFFLASYLAGGASVWLIWGALAADTRRSRRIGLVVSLAWPAAFVVLLYLAFVIFIDRAYEREAERVLGGGR